MCDLEDGHCEAALLADYETDDAACLEYEGERYNHLFYRGKGARPELTFAVRGTPGGVVSVGGQGHAPAGAMLRLTRGESEVFVSRVAATADGSVDVAPADASSTIGVTAGRRAVRDAMLELGLTNAEAESFLRAWQGELFTVEAGLADALIYFAPPTATDTLSR